MRSELAVDGYIYYTYKDGEPDHYMGACRVIQCCDVGVIKQMLGIGLLMAIGQDLDHGKLRAAGIKSIQGYTLCDIADSCEELTKTFPNLFFERIRTCVHDGRDFVWINVERNH